MPGRTPKLKELAELHAHVIENERLSYQLNVPFSGLLFSLVMAGSQHFFGETTSQWFEDAPIDLPNGSNVAYTDIAGEQKNIRTEHYITELHRVSLEE